MVRIREYYQDPNTPTAHDVLPAAFAAVRNSAGELLLVRRIDDGNWELPGGRIEVGESASHTVAREVAEESGITIELTALAGVYSDPTHVLVDPNDTIHQQLALCFHAVPTPHSDGAPPRPAPPTSKPTLQPGSTSPRSPTSRCTRRCDYESTTPSARRRNPTSSRQSANQRALRQLRLAQETRPIAPRQDNTGRRADACWTALLPLSPSRAGTRHDYPTVIGHHGRQTTM
jgi:ADP-ribose pyrophosphatase YjhB (NUDIX family)